MSDLEHEWARELLAAYLTGELSDEDGARIDAHVEGCPECDADLEEFRKHDLSIEEPEPPRPDLKDHVIRSRRFSGFSKPRSGIGRALLSGAAVVLLAIVGFVITAIDQAPERLIALDAPEIAACTVAPSAPHMAMEIERPREIYERRGIPSDFAPTDEPAIFFPEAKMSDHNESAGDSADFLSYIKGDAGGVRGRQAGRNPGVYDTMGVGTGGGGVITGGAFGGRSQKIVKLSPGEPAEHFKPAAVFGSLKTGTGKVMVPPSRERRASPARGNWRSSISTGTATWICSAQPRTGTCRR